VKTTVYDTTQRIQVFTVCRCFPR